ncbi:MAG: MFS family permease [Candidatus Aldehydirespiratoraceae bacterium]|jgi:MFS family permease
MHAMIAAVPPSSPAATQEQLQRRTLFTLIGSVGPAGMGMAGGFAATTLASREIVDNESLATLAATMISIGGALIAVPLSQYMSRRGRRPGLRIGWTIASIGALFAVLAVETSTYPLLVLGTLGIGAGNGTNLAARYAAADLAPEDRRAQAIGVLVWAASIGSILGPTVALGLTEPPAKWLGFEPLSGPYLMAILVFVIAATVVEIFLRPDPLLTATGGDGVTAPQRPNLKESFRRIASNRLAVIAVGAMAVGQGVMVAIMTVTPLHMEDGAHEKKIIGFVISLHIVGMYLFAPVVGWLVDRLPSSLIVGIAGVTLFVGGEVASHTDAQDRNGVFLGLFLVGLGWSFAMISGSSLLTSAFSAHERAAVQGAADFTMTTAGAAAGLASGVVVEISSYHSLSHWAGVAALALVAAAFYPLVVRSAGLPTR